MPVVRGDASSDGESPKWKCFLCGCMRTGPYKEYRGQRFDSQCWSGTRSRRRAFGSNVKALEEDTRLFEEQPELWKEKTVKFRDASDRKDGFREVQDMLKEYEKNEDVEANLTEDAVAEYTKEDWKDLKCPRMTESEASEDFDEKWEEGGYEKNDDGEKIVLKKLPKTRKKVTGRQTLKGTAKSKTTNPTPLRSRDLPESDTRRRPHGGSLASGSSFPGEKRLRSRSRTPPLKPAAASAVQKKEEEEVLTEKNSDRVTSRKRGRRERKRAEAKTAEVAEYQKLDDKKESLEELIESCGLKKGLRQQILDLKERFQEHPRCPKKLDENLQDLTQVATEAENIMKKFNTASEEEVAAILAQIESLEKKFDDVKKKAEKALATLEYLAASQREEKRSAYIDVHNKTTTLQNQMIKQGAWPQRTAKALARELTLYEIYDGDGEAPPTYSRTPLDSELERNAFMAFSKSDGTVLKDAKN